METRVWTQTHEVVIAADSPTILIGDRINPTGQKRLSGALQKRDMGLVQREALSQVNAGADILDVNVGISDANEIELLPQVVKAIAAVVDTPLSLDSKNPEALKATLSEYQGKAIINSVSGEDKSLDEILPLVKEYKTAVVGLTIDDNGIPSEAKDRFAIAHKIVDRAKSLGIPPEDVIIDCLVLTVATDSTAAKVTLDAVRMVKENLGNNQTSGASNISYGMPDRESLNSIFLTLAIQAGVTCPYVNVLRSRHAVLAVDLLLARDRHARRFISAYRQRQSMASG